MKVRILQKQGKFYPQKYVDVEDNLIFRPHYRWEYYYITKSYKELFTKVELSFTEHEQAKDFLLSKKEKVVEEKVVEEFEL